jgi:hypothetical protein
MEMKILFPAIVAMMVGGGHQSAASQTSGVEAKGLRITLASVSAAPSRIPALTIALQNTGPSDFVLNLGSMLANGKVMFPQGVRLQLVDPAGQSRDLEFFDRRYPGVAGRLDDFIVPLRAGATYSWSTTLDLYWRQGKPASELTTAAGRYRLTARFDGKGASSVNLDMQGVALLNFWKGTAQSNTIEFEIPQASVRSSDWSCPVKPVESCFKHHARLSSQNGIAYKLWLIGTTRMLGLANEPPLFLGKYLDMTSPDHSYVFGDFDICPIEPDMPGNLRRACVMDAQKLVVQQIQGSTPPFRLLATWREHQ